MATKRINNINTPVNYNEVVYHKDITVKDVDYLQFSADTTNNIILISTGITENILIDYKTVRGDSVKSGILEIIYDPSDNTIFIDDTEYSEIYLSGVTFDADINNGNIRLQVFIDDSSLDNADFNYSIKYFK